MFRWIHVIGGAALVVAVAGAGSAWAGVYKWKDADGNVHFSDTPPPAAAPGGKGGAAVQGEVTQVEMRGSFGDFQVATKPPIRNTGGGPSVALDSFTLQLDRANSNNVTIGRVFVGDKCERGIDLQWKDGVQNLKGDVAELAVADRFKNYGYSLNVARGGGAALGTLHLDAQLASLKMDLCKQGGARAYVKLAWTLRRPGLTQAVFHGTSEGAYDGWGHTVDVGDVFVKAVFKATENLLGDRAFVDGMNGATPTAAPADVAALNATAVHLAVRYGNGQGTFRANSEALLRSSVTVKTDRGHGSGVVIDDAGYALTNAHVVGAQTQVQVLLDADAVSAKVVRIDPRADVALLQFDAKGHGAVRIARAEPHPGDPLYVVGTPLSLELSHSVTQGILSGVRDVNGSRLFQTDAAVNPGNSGGPVFNESGELVALSVSGLVNADGASMNVNYLIPVMRALAAVGAVAD